MSIGLTQREVAQMIKISERAVREIERGRFANSSTIQRLRQIWQDYLSGTLEERDSRLTRVEIEALFCPGARIRRSIGYREGVAAESRDNRK